MKIAMISTPFLRVPPRDYGGTELVVYELVEGLVHRGHDVTLFATGDSTTSAELPAGATPGQWPPDYFADLDHVTWAMREVIDRGDFDLVHVHSAWPRSDSERFGPPAPHGVYAPSRPRPASLLLLPALPRRPLRGHLGRSGSPGDPPALAQRDPSRTRSHWVFGPPPPIGLRLLCRSALGGERPRGGDRCRATGRSPDQGGRCGSSRG